MGGQLTKEDIRGIIPPLVTPFLPSEEIDEENFRRELKYMLSLQVGGVAVGGSTGEGYALAPEELARLVGITIAETGAQVPVIAGIIATHAREALRRATLVREAGAHALMVTPPIYQPCSVEGLVQYYDALWRSTQLPIIVYNVVSRTPLIPAMIMRLVDIAGVIGIKESSGGTLETLDELLASLGNRIAVTWAQDTLMLQGYAAGAVGSITAINTVLPEHSIQEFEAIQSGDMERARIFHRQVTNVAKTFTGPNKPAKIKACINLQGRPVGPARRPYGPVTPEEESTIRAHLKTAGVLPAMVGS